jgi:hypothetical protein
MSQPTDLVYPTTRLRLSYWIEQKGMTSESFAKQCEMKLRDVRKYANGEMTRYERDTLARFAQVLGITVPDLFEPYYDNVLTALQQCGDAVIHVTSRTFHESRADKRAEDARKQVPRELLSTWDIDACNELQARLYGAGGVRVHVRRHAWGTGPGTQHVDVWRMVSDGRAHIIIGSPATSGFAEEMVSAFYGVPPYNAAMCKAFPHLFLWPSFRGVVSSFGLSSKQDEYGVVKTATGKIIAKRTVIECGRGEDAGLIVVYRVPVIEPKCARREGLVIALLGLSGPATLACARVLLRQASAAHELFPSVVKSPLMRAVTVLYDRPPGDNTRDDREIVTDTWRLVTADEEDAATETVPADAWPKDCLPYTPASAVQTEA